MSKRERFEGGNCPTCGRSAYEHKHTMSQGLVTTILKFAHIYDGNPVKLSSAGFTHTQQCNFQKLKYFGLVTKSTRKEGGTWRLTDKGFDFAAGKIAIPLSVWTFDDEVVEYETLKIRAKDQLDGTDYWHKYDAYAYNLRRRNLKAV